jgi:hypothetical protein
MELALGVVDGGNPRGNSGFESMPEFATNCTISLAKAGVNAFLESSSNAL